MRVAFLLPCSPDAPRGNATTAQRLANGFAALGWEVALHGPDDTDPTVADFLIALHAAHCGPRGAELAIRLDAPLVLLFTGTDLERVTEPAVAQVLADASFRVALSEAAAAEVRTQLAPASAPIHVIHQAVLPLPLPTANVPLPDTPNDAEILLLLAGIRAVKDPLRAVRALAPLAIARPKLRLWIAGPSLEDDTVQELQVLLEDHPWASWVGSIRRSQLLPWIQSARLVLSTSKHEGAAPNALLEAALSGTPTLASNIPSHQDFPGALGIFSDDEELRSKAVRLLENAEHWKAEQARQSLLAQRAHDPKEEIRQWADLLGQDYASF